MALALDTLVVFGYGPVERRGGRAHLNVYARLNALAAGTLLTEGHAKHLLLTGGRTGGADLPSEAELIGAYIVRVFGVSRDRFTLEPHATDTIDNLVLAANILDGAGSATQRLGFLALEPHLPRIHYLADLLGLTGQGVALEGVVEGRGDRHRRLLAALKASPSYAKLTASQVRAMRGLREVPEFWLPPLAQLGDERLLRIYRMDTVRRFLRARGLPAPNLTAFRNTLATLPRRFPEPQPSDLLDALEAAFG